tara:strand:- start:209 stop:517 length:309 start_codon:yes stop_codon:yes gene_type:complete
MIIYNVTCNVELSISKEWLIWMKEIHILEVMECGIFSSVQINKVITNNDDGISYAIQYVCSTMKDLHNYQVNFASEFQQKHIDRYGDKVISFRTILEVIANF